MTNFGWSSRSVKGTDVKNEDDYKVAFQNIRKDGFDKALSIAHEGAMAHSGFQHYTTLKVLQSMLKNR